MRFLVVCRDTSCSLVYQRGDEGEYFDIGVLQEYADGPTGVPSQYRTEAREAFVRWDCGQRVRHVALREAAPVIGPYQVGDVVSYCREARTGEHGFQWSVGCRLIGFEKDKDGLGEGLPRTCWVICDCVAVDRLRPCSAAEPLMYHNVQAQATRNPTLEVSTKWGFVDERLPLSATMPLDEEEHQTTVLTKMIKTRRQTCLKR